MLKRGKLVWVYGLCITATILVWLYVFLKSNKLHIFNTKTTEITIQNKIINAGLRPLHKSVDTFFVIENIGKYPLVIQNVKTDCHCTASTWDTKPIQPHQATQIKVRYDGMNIGFFQKRILVECNVLHSPLLLIFRGEIE